MVQVLLGEQSTKPKLQNKPKPQNNLYKAIILPINKTPSNEIHIQVEHINK